MLKLISIARLIISCFNACAYADLVFYHFASTASHLHFKFSHAESKKKEKKSHFYSDMLLFHNFYPLIQNVLRNP